MKWIALRKLFSRAQAVQRQPLSTHLAGRRSTQSRGQAGEDAAVEFLKNRGYTIVTRNWRPKSTPGVRMRGELDCIAWAKGDRSERVLCFVEVKARTSHRGGAPQEAVTPAKQRQISRLANAYISTNPIGETACRFDVVEVWLLPGHAPRCALHRNAFDYSGGAR